MRSRAGAKTALVSIPARADAASADNVLTNGLGQLDGRQQ